MGLTVSCKEYNCLHRYRRVGSIVGRQGGAFAVRSLDACERLIWFRCTRLPPIVPTSKRLNLDKRSKPDTPGVFTGCVYRVLCTTKNATPHNLQHHVHVGFRRGRKRPAEKLTETSFCCCRLPLVSLNFATC